MVRATNCWRFPSCDNLHAMNKICDKFKSFAPGKIGKITSESHLRVAQNSGKVSDVLLRLPRSIPSAVANFARAYKYLCEKLSCVQLYVRP